MDGKDYARRFAIRHETQKDHQYRVQSKLDEEQQEQIANEQLLAEASKTALYTEVLGLGLAFEEQAPMDEDFGHGNDGDGMETDNEPSDWRNTVAADDLWQIGDAEAEEDRLREMIRAMVIDGRGRDELWNEDEPMTAGGEPASASEPEDHLSGEHKFGNG